MMLFSVSIAQDHADSVHLMNVGTGSALMTTVDSKDNSRYLATVVHPSNSLYANEGAIWYTEYLENNAFILENARDELCITFNGLHQYVIGKACEDDNVDMQFYTEFINIGAKLLHFKSNGYCLSKLSKAEPCERSNKDFHWQLVPVADP